ncbi:MAG TPA: glycosyltransferase 87 family protein [Anaerolineales bacterium]|nr:glycosyltransferase 87 family protein [Anaerolineales bacterium]
MIVFKRSAVLILAVLTIIALTWGNYFFSVQNPGGTDFLVHWVGARSLLMGETPYSNNVAINIQTMIYGRPALPGEHEFYVVYPLYSSLFFIPFALIDDYQIARAIWMTVLELGLILLTSKSLEIVAWKLKPLSLAFFMIFSLFWYHGIRQIVNGNIVVWVAVFLTFGVGFLKNRKDALAGILFAMSTIKPHLVLLPLACIFLWLLSLRRWQAIWFFLGAVPAFVIAGMLIVPDWPLQNLREVFRYTSYNPPATPGSALAALLPIPLIHLDLVFGTGVVLLLIHEWRKMWGKAYESFLRVIGITLVLSQWSGITTDPGNFILLFLPLVIVLSILQVHIGDWSVLAFMLLLFFGLWGIFLWTVDLTGLQVQSPIMFFPLPLFLLMGFYCVNLDKKNRPPRRSVFFIYSPK